MGQKEKELWDRFGKTQKNDVVKLGAHTAYQYRESCRRILWSISRYVFAQKMIGNEKNILELGCSDGFGAHFLAESATHVLGVDFDEEAIAFAQKNEEKESIKYICDDFLGKEYGRFDAVVSFDVIEHIYPENENAFMETVCKNLSRDGVAIIGTPSIEQQKFSKENVKGAHVNCFSGERLEELLGRYFHNVFMFTQNDELIHAGYFRTANYLLGLCCNPRE